MNIISRALACIFLLVSVSGYSNPLQVVSWGGDYAASLKSELLEPFTVQTGVLLEQKTHGGFVDSAGAAGVIELSLHDAIEACESGELMFLPTDSLSVSGDQSIEDFVPDTLQPCSVGHSIWSTVLAYDPHRYTELDRPILINDFFNTDFYPGKRVIRKSPMVIAEWSLAASGVAVSDIYQALDNTSIAWALIEKKLSDIESEIIWVDTDLEALNYIRTGQAAFAMIGSESVVRSLAERGFELGVVWDAAFTEAGMWGISTDAPDPDVAWKFLQYATSAANSGKIPSVFGYGPARYSTLKMVERKYQKLLPSWPENHTNTIWGNSRWWREHGGKLNRLFFAWVDTLETDLTLAVNHDGIYNEHMSVLRSTALVDAGVPFLPPATTTIVGKF